MSAMDRIKLYDPDNGTVLVGATHFGGDRATTWQVNLIMQSHLGNMGTLVSVEAKGGDMYGVLVVYTFSELTPLD
jgi:hypothetical protein